MVNHQSIPNCVWSHKNGISITSVKNIKKNEEISINYGHNENIELLAGLATKKIAFHSILLENSKNILNFTKKVLRNLVKF